MALYILGSGCGRSAVPAPTTAPSTLALPPAATPLALSYYPQSPIAYFPPGHEDHPTTDYVSSTRSHSQTPVHISTTTSTQLINEKNNNEPTNHGEKMEQEDEEMEEEGDCILGTSSSDSSSEFLAKLSALPELLDKSASPLMVLEVRDDEQPTIQSEENEEGRREKGGPSFCLQAWNQRLANLLGYSKEEMIGSRLSAFVPLEHSVNLRASIEDRLRCRACGEAATSPIYQTTNVLKTRQGASFFVSIKKRIFFSTVDGRPLFVIARVYCTGEKEN